MMPAMMPRLPGACMNDERVWEFERELWLGDIERYQYLIDDACVMVVPAEPFVMVGGEAANAVSRTPRWTQVTFDRQVVTRPAEGLIVIGYHARASREEGPEHGEVYEAYCTSTLHRLGHEEWRVVQHQQTPQAAVIAEE